MTTEREELRLTVSLVDNVSAGLNKIKGEFKDLTEGGGKQHAEKFKRENTEAIAILKRMTGEAGEAYKAFGMMRLGALGAAGGVALLGYEVAKQVKEWGELAEKVRAANQVARAFGIDPGAMRNIQEQLEAAGVSAEQSQGALTKFLDTIGELQRNPAFRKNILEQTLEGNVPAMAARLKQIEEAKTATEKLNLARQLGIDVEQKALARGESPERAAGERRRLEEMLGYNRLALGVAGQLKELTEEQARWDKERNTSLEAYANTLGRINHQWDEISKLLSGPIFSENSPLVRGAKALEAVLTNAKDMLEFIKRGGFDVIMHPLDPEARQRSIDAVKELQHERHERMTPEERAAEHAAEEKAKAAAEATRKQMEDRMEHLRKVAPPQYFSGSGGADITANMPESSNIEDRRGEFGDRAKYMKENTAELKRLNDFLIGPAATGPGGVGGYGFLSGGAGGGGGFAGRLGLGAGGAGGINIPGAGAGAGAGPGAAGPGAGAGASSGAGAGVGGAGRPAGLADEAGNPVDLDTMKQAETLGRSGDVPGLQKLFAARGYRMSGPACGIIASKYARAAGFKPPDGGAVASNWHNFGEKMKPEDINAPGHPFGSMFGTYNHRRYGGNVGAPLPTGATGGQVMSLVPGSYDPKTGKVDVVDQYGYSHGKRNISDMDLRFAGADAVAEAAARRGGQPGSSTSSGQPGGGTDEQRNIHNFMRGLSFLETSNDPRIAAQSEGGNTGFFRQNANDAAWAKRHGIADPRVGSYDEQAKANFEYMKKYPGAQEAIRRGDFTTAASILHKNWVGLPGGSQPQNAARMREWHRILAEGSGGTAGAGDDGGGGASPVSRDQIERARSILNRNQSMKVEGSGKLSVDVNAPKGTRVGAQGKGLFKTVEINRQTQMEPAKRGPADAGEE